MENETSPESVPAPIGKKPVFVFAAFAIIAVLIAVMVASLLFFEIPVSNSDFLKQKQQADQLRRSGDLNAMIAAYQELVQQAPNKDMEALAKTYLALDLQRRDGPGDVKAAMDIYKSIINDYSVPPLRRALVFGDIGQRYIPTESFVRDHLNQEPFISFLPPLGEKFDTLSFSKKVFEESDEIYPNSDAKFNLARILAAQFPLMDEAEKRDAAFLIQQYIEEGDKLTTALPYQPGNLVEQYMNRAVGLWTSGAVLGTPSIEDRKAAFKKAIEEGLKYPDDPRSQSALAQTYLFYAGFLQRAGNRENEVQNVLNAFLSNPGSQGSVVKKAAQAYAMRQAPSVARDMYTQLADVSPDFKAYLIGLGWNF